MSAKVYVDTNILVHAHDADAGHKQLKAQNVLLGLSRERSGAVSMQVLQEFYTTVTRKLASPLSREKAREAVDDFAHWCVKTTPEEIRWALRIEDEAKISFWDALIVAAAIRGGAKKIIFEDLNHRQQISGIPIENPFRLP